MASLKRTFLDGFKEFYVFAILCLFVGVLLNTCDLNRLSQGMLGQCLFLERQRPGYVWVILLFCFSGDFSRAM